ncbi:MAG: WXG100 family type VII secretion target [Synergistaceae bacterium]|nr:WXG100 family type VII secretion target [Synergistaceae bacterium]
MAMPYEFLNLANTARDNKNAISTSNRKYEDSVSKVSSSWNSDIGVAFRDEHKRIRAQISTIMKKYDNLSTRLTSHSNIVKRADDEESNAWFL